MDDDLSPRVRQLVDVVMEEDVPPPAIADGSWEVVVSRLTIEAAGEAACIAAPHGTPRRRWIVFTVVALVIAVVGGSSWLVLRPRPDVQNTAVPPATAHAALPAPPSTPASSEPAPAPPPRLAIGAAKLLDDADSAEPTRALELLARHAELAPLGPDTERRMALRVVTLCRLDRTEDARAEARGFLSAPRDPRWTKLVRASCAGRSPSP